MPPRVSFCNSPGSSPAACQFPVLGDNLLGVLDKKADMEAAGIRRDGTLAGLHQVEGEAIGPLQYGESFLAAHGDELEAEEAREEVAKGSDFVRAQIEVIELHGHFLSSLRVADRMPTASRLEGRRPPGDCH